MKNFFLRTLPQDKDGHWLNIGLMVGGVVFFILFFFRPFGLATYEGGDE